MLSRSRCDGILNGIQSDNRKFQSRPLVGRKVRHCTARKKSVTKTTEQVGSSLC